MTTAQTEARAIWSAARNHWLKAGRHGTQEAADDIAADIITTALAAKDAELAGALEASERFSVAWRDAEKRAERAEAQLSEANKKLELAERMMTKDSLCEAERLEEGLRLVRRALEAQGGENG